jgi:hypothetical protein
MGFNWQSGVQTLSEILREHRVEPDRVTDVEAAWRAFGQFLQLQADGIESPDDGFIVQWGRYSWNDDKPSLSFTRQLAVPDAEDPDYVGPWQLDLALCFDEPGLERLGSADTGFQFTPIGPERAAALTAMRTDLHRDPLLRTIWQTKPISTQLDWECVC